MDNETESTTKIYQQFWEAGKTSLFKEVNKIKTGARWKAMLKPRSRVKDPKQLTSQCFRLQWMTVIFCVATYLPQVSVPFPSHFPLSVEILKPLPSYTEKPKVYL